MSMRYVDRCGHCGWEKEEGVCAFCEPEKYKPILQKRLDELKENMEFCKKCGEYITEDGTCSNPCCPEEMPPYSEKYKLKQWCDDFCIETQISDSYELEDCIKKLVKKFEEEIKKGGIKQ